MPSKAARVTEPLLLRRVASSRETKVREPEAAETETLEAEADKLSMLADNVAPLLVREKLVFWLLSRRDSVEADKL